MHPPARSETQLSVTVRVPPVLRAHLVVGATSSVGAEGFKPRDSLPRRGSYLRWGSLDRRNPRSAATVFRCVECGSPSSAPASVPEPLAEELRTILGDLALLLRVEGRDLPTETALSSLELRVLSRLVFQGPTTVKELIAAIAVPASTMASATGRLCGRDLIERRVEPQDHRVVELRVTEHGVALLREGDDRFSHLATEMLCVLEPDDQASLVAALNRARDRLLKAFPRAAR